MPKPQIITYHGMRPYFRRTLPSGLVRIYLKDMTGGKQTIDITPGEAALFRTGKTYTMEFTPHTNARGLAPV